MSDACGLPGLAGRRALVTGGSRGIGRATVVLLARCGASVGISCRVAVAEAEETVRRAEAAWRQAQETSGMPATPPPRWWHVAGDLGESPGVEALFERVRHEFGALDIFVGNAGVWNARAAPLERIEPHEWAAMLQANLTSIYLTVRAAIPLLSEGGRIVLVSSTAGQRGEAGHAHYAATKGAVQTLVKSLAVELGPRGITVNAVAPGWVDTELSATVLQSDARASIEREIPLGRVATPEDVAGPIAFLASALARHITGEVLNVNGGSVRCG